MRRESLSQPGLKEKVFGHLSSAGEDNVSWSRFAVIILMGDVGVVLMRKWE